MKLSHLYLQVGNLYERFSFAWATYVRAVIFFRYSITTANTYHNGVNISMGSNPNFTFGSQSCTSNETVTMVPTDQVLFITDVVTATTYDSDTITLSTNNTTLGKLQLDFLYSCLLWRHTQYEVDRSKWCLRKQRHFTQKRDCCSSR